MKKGISYLALVLLLAVSPVTLRPAAARNQTAPAAAAPQTDLASQLAAIEKTLDEKRKELGIPGMALAIVKDDKVIYEKGFGLRDIDRNLPVTPETLFAIGSSSKAFTAMSVVMSADDGKLSLDDSPKKHLPYFQLQDPESDAKVTIRDLLSHRSGLNRTDLAWYTGQLTSEEIIRVAGRAKPIAKIGEKFLYQNVMFLAAGEIAAKVNGTSFDRLIVNRIFKPLGMTSSTLSVPEMKKAKDHSRGYDYNFSTKATRELPTRDLTPIAPAGAINSNVRDMAQWVRLMLGGGVHNGKRLVSEKGFAELVANQMKVSDQVNYGLGWFLRDWKGHKVVEHGGNIDGFNALVATMPDQSLGFVLLTNVTGSSIGQTAMQTIWTNIVGDPTGTASAALPAGDPGAEAGLYRFPEAGFDVTIAVTDGKLTMTVPGQPTYTLENVGGRRYKLSAPAPDGFFATFRPAKDDPKKSEMYLEQPQGNYVLPRKDETAAPPAPASAQLLELVGFYELPGGSGPGTIEVADKDGKVSVVVPGQPPYALVEKSKDVYSLSGLPEAFEVTVRRDGKGAASVLSIKQPQGTFEFKRTAGAAVAITIDELMAKSIDALGGEEANRKLTSRVTTVELNMENQGVTGTATVYAKAPNMTATESTFTAFGKTLGTTRDYFDGTGGAEESSFGETTFYTGKQLEDVRTAADFYALLNWKKLYKEVTIKRRTKVGDEDAYAVYLVPEKGNPVTYHVSAKTFLPLKVESVQWSETMNVGLPVTTLFKDYQKVDGVMIPFTTVITSDGAGNIIARIKQVKHNVAIEERVFKKK